MKLFFFSLLTFSCLALGTSNRVYIHPFFLFSFENVSCEVIKSMEHTHLETVHPLTPLTDSTEPDVYSESPPEELKNLTTRTSVLAELQNVLGLRLYVALSKQKKGNILLSPLNAFGTLVTLYLGVSKKTASPYQILLGLNWESKNSDCVYLINGHKVLRTLQALNSLTDKSQNELRTLVWAFINSDADLSKDFVRGMQDFSDASFVRAVDFSQPKEAQSQVNSFIQKTSDGKVEDLFTDIDRSTNLLFASSVHFKGNWKKAFQPERLTTQDFRAEKSTVKVPFMTHTGDYMHLVDSGRKCSVVKLGLSERTYMLLVLPDEGAHLHHIENQLLSEEINRWHKHLKERYLELSLPKFSMTAVTDLRSVLSDMQLDKLLLGSEANFERMSSKGNFTVDKVFNKVLFEMSDEEGSEVPIKSQDDRVPLKVTFNRPFFFVIVESNFNAILMLGRIQNPAV